MPSGPAANPGGTQSGPPFRRILLVGFMGSGKSTVGALLARRLGWSFLDIDREVERREGRTIPELFQEIGEPGFREIEDRVTREALGGEDVVLATGGGWPCREGRMESLDGDTLSIWLEAAPEVILDRTSRAGRRRPLLDVERPMDRIVELLAEREHFYRKSLWRVESGERAPDEVVRALVERLATDPKRPLRG